MTHHRAFRRPDRLTRDDLEAYFSSLIRSHAWSTVKLNQQWQWIDIVKPPQVKSLPDILTQAEISCLINATREARYQTYILTVYSMGLRLGEALNLKVGDIDAERMRVHVHHGKGGKDRFVILPTASLQALRRYWSLHHGYATHLVEAGLNLRAIQHAMGHESPKTTAIYTQLTELVQQNAVDVINHMINRFDITLDGEA